ncbi:MAG: hypothetical protein L3K14_03405 [Thermoplasmata archaeon]|nr:hypothetical protein [Thermoplasmata archaeon]
MTDASVGSGGPSQRDAAQRLIALPGYMLRSRAMRGGFLVGLVLMVLLSGLGISGISGIARAAPGPAPVSNVLTSSHAVPSSPGTVVPNRPASGVAPAASSLASNPSSGRGVFFTTTQLPQVAPTNHSCAYVSTFSRECFNATYDPVLNLTPTGNLVMAYTALTNNTTCPNFLPSLTNYNHTQSEIGFVRSTNGGASWSAPLYLGNPDCSSLNGSKYPSAYEPTITSLANGTLVLAYVEYNMSNGSYVNYQYFGSYYYNVPYDRLVVSESYDSGLSWTTPVVINASVNLGLNNSSFAPQRPWITATGHTVYLTWYNATSALTTFYNFTNNSYSSRGSAAIHLVASLDGGKTWGAPVQLRTFPGNGAQYSINPTVVVLPTGRLVIAYVTNASYVTPYPGLGAAWIVNLEVAESTTNGTIFSYYQAVHDALLYLYGPYSSIDPSPQMAFANATGQLFIAYTAEQVAQVCDPFFGCYNTTEPSVYLANTSDLGLSWHNHLVGPHLMGNGNFFRVYHPAIAVNATGVVDLAVTYVNSTICQVGTCGATTQVFLQSTDNGSSFEGPYLMSANYSVFADSPEGEYATMVVAGGHVWSAWSHAFCPTAYFSIFYCYPPSPYASWSLVTVASLFTGAGNTLTFVEHGLLNGLSWWVNVMGNTRAGIAPASLSVSGVPPGENVTWNASTPAGGYGIRYLATQSVNPPAAFASSATIYENYSEQVLLQISTVPALPALAGPFNNYCGAGYYWNQTGCPGINYNVTPLPGQDWVNYGSTVDLNVSAYPITCYGVFQLCSYTFFWFSELNLTFLAWNGTGHGSVNTTANFTSIVVTAPINETASFQLNGWCYYNFPSAGTHIQICLPSNQTIAFQEQGLPSGTQWGVTISGNGGTESGTNTSRQISLSGNATAGLVSYWVWTVPGPAPGEYWVPTTSPLSPVILPFQPVVTVQYTLQTIATQPFPIVFSETGLPSGSSWSAELGGTGYHAVAGSTTTVEDIGAAPANGSFVYGTNGTAYYVSSISIDPLVVNSSVTTVAPPALITPTGPTFVTVHYSPMYRLTVAAGTGGSAGPTARWVVGGAAVTLTATPNAGYSFVGWTGTGPGSTNATQDLQLAPTIHPTGPVSELATFVLIPPPVWTVTVRLIGLPVGMAASLALGPRSYSGSALFHIAGLASGSYNLSVPDATPNGTVGARYVPSSTSTSYATTGTGALVIASNGTLNVTFVAQYRLTVSSTGSGTVSPTGAGWYSAGVPVTLTATPATHSKVAAWVGSGNGSVTAGSQLTVGVLMNGPVSEVVQFVYNPPPSPATFQLTVTVTGLPATVAWSVAVAGTGAAGMGSSLVVGGLNGSYTVIVPTVYVGLDQRYVPANGGSFARTVTSNGSLTVAFTHEYLVTVDASAGGSVSASVWAAAGSTVTVTATANATSTFVNWTGTVVGTLATLNLTVNGPILETANFEATPAKIIATSATAGLSTSLLILAVLLVVGAGVGVVMSRRRGPPPTVVAASAPSPGPTGGAPTQKAAPSSGQDWEEYGSSPPSGSPDWQE